MNSRLLPLLLCIAACGDDVQLFERVQTDVFTQELRRKVDILLVVDNSCSMIDEQQKLAANFDQFIEQFLEADVDYQIGVVTTDMEDASQAGRLHGLTPIISSQMVLDEARQTFENNVKVCATGSGFEMGLAAAAAALTEPLVSTENAGFMRDDAALSVVVVSDEEDDSPLTVGEYLTVLKGVKGDVGYRDDSLINISAVTGPMPAGCEQPSPIVPDCRDGLDEQDGDGVIDCVDPDCSSSRWCTIAGIIEIDCADGTDDDGDTFTDCADADCGGEGTCRETNCIDGVDNDDDGELDCGDLDCLLDYPSICAELSCSDGEYDHHGSNPFPNLLMDCADPSCFAPEETEDQCFAERTLIDYRERCDLTVTYDDFTGGPESEDGPDVDDATSLDLERAGCADPDCASYWMCQPQFRAEGWAECSDCVDNDADGTEDCEDIDCLESPVCDNPYPIEPASRYIDVVQRSGGIVTSICSGEWSGLVRELGLNISGLRNIFYLSTWPQIDTIEVRLNDPGGLVLTVGWQFEVDQNRVVFTDEARPPAGSRVYINYKRSSRSPDQQVAE